MLEQFFVTKPDEERHRRRFASLDEVLNFKIPKVEQFKGGQSNPTYLLTGSDGKRYALRRKPPGKLLPSAHAVDREYRVITALHKVNFPVARPHVLCEDESVIGTAFYVMDFVDGRVMWDQSLPGMTKDERYAIWDELNRVIAQLHMLDYRELGLESFGKPGNYIERQIGRWSKQYQASELEKIEAMDNLIAWLPKNIPPGDETTIVHGDFRPGNLCFAPDGTVRAVFDWELATLGEPLADLGWLVSTWAQPGDATAPTTPGPSAAPGFPTRDELVSRYARRTGRDVSDLPYYVAFSRWRSACIGAGVRARYEARVMADDGYARAISPSHTLDDGDTIQASPPEQEAR